MASIRCAHCKETHSSVAQVRECSSREADQAWREGKKQFARQEAVQEASAYAVKFSDPYAAVVPPRVPTVVLPVRRTNQPADKDGMYLKDGIVYKVQVAVHGSGRLYAKQLEFSGDRKSGKFIYAPGAIRFLAAKDKMSEEQAKEFGQLYGFCCVCGRTLTDETSIALGIGPVCGKREW